jgi:hypothetical protein
MGFPSAARTGHKMKPRASACVKKHGRTPEDTCKRPIPDQKRVGRTGLRPQQERIMNSEGAGEPSKAGADVRARFQPDDLAAGLFEGQQVAAGLGRDERSE